MWWQWDLAESGQVTGPLLWGDLRRFWWASVSLCRGWASSTSQSCTFSASTSPLLTCAATAKSPNTPSCSQEALVGADTGRTSFLCKASGPWPSVFPTNLTHWQQTAERDATSGCLHIFACLFYFERGDREQTREIFSPCQAEAESWVLHTGHPHGWWEHTCLNRHPLPPGVPMAGSWSGSGAGTLFQTISDAPTQRVTLRSPRSPPLDGSALRTAAQDHQVLDSPSWPHPCECHLCIY